MKKLLAILCIMIYGCTPPAKIASTATKKIAAKDGIWLNVQSNVATATVKASVNAKFKERGIYVLSATEYQAQLKRFWLDFYKTSGEKENSTGFQNTINAETDIDHLHIYCFLKEGKDGLVLDSLKYIHTRHVTVTSPERKLFDIRNFSDRSLGTVMDSLINQLFDINLRN